MKDVASHWLIPFDGSEHSCRALRAALAEAKAQKDLPRLSILNVQKPLPSDVTRFIDRKLIDDFHREAGEKDLSQANTIIREAGLTCSEHILVGPVAQTIVEFAVQHACTKLAMGTHGHNSMTGLLMGSVTTKVLSQIALPVLLVK
mgnify:CR=1 FL=1